jgi:hypothetical protein
MNKLREKIEKVYIYIDKEPASIECTLGETDAVESVIELEQITDDFSVAFAQWINSDGWELERREQRTYTFAELLQHFKTNIYGK